MERATACSPPGQPLEEIKIEPGSWRSPAPDLDAPPEIFDAEVRRVAELWRSCGTLLLPVGLSRRGERSFERHVLLYLLHRYGLCSLPAVLRRRALRLFARGWHQSEGGLALRRLTELLEGRLSASEIVELVESAMEQRAREAAV